MEPLDKEVFNEYQQRVKDEFDRTSHRLTSLERTIDHINELTASVKELAVNMQTMVETQKDQNARLRAIEDRDGEQWRAVIGYILSAVIGCGITLLISHII